MPAVIVVWHCKSTELESHIQCQLGGRIREFRLIVADDGLILRGQVFEEKVEQLLERP